MIRNRILITGANGFVGQHLCAHLVAIGRKVTACVRPKATGLRVPGSDNLRIMVVPDITAYAYWPEQLTDVDTVIHLAARVHVMQDRSSDPLAEFRKVNVAATSALVEQAARAGVRRFIYVSSIKVNGEATSSGEFHADDLPGYRDPYGQSKWEAEQKLESLAVASHLEWVVIRPTLVFGPGVRGNFLSLMRCIRRGLPLPLGSVDNRRSLVSVYNLVDLIASAIDHPAAAGQRFLVKDPEDLSTCELVRRIAKALDCRPRLLPVRTSLLVSSARLLRKEAIVQRLIGSLVVNTEKTAELLQWRAPMSFDSALAETCAWFQTTSPTEGRHS
jgi:nucleoside-diphosphate-sugar epimerase